MTRLVQTVAVALSLLWSVGVVSAATYTFTPLNFPGAVATDARGVNDQGHVVGIYQCAACGSFSRGFLFGGTGFAQ
jgi:hypothetical protein